MKKAIITGIYGQDGSFLCEYLLKIGYEVHGFVQRTLSDNSKRIKSYFAQNEITPHIHVVDLYDFSSVKNAVQVIQPNELYHLAASHVSSEGDFGGEALLYQRNVIATSNVLYAISQVCPSCKVVTAGSCLVFDDTDTIIQNELTNFNSCSFYGLAKISENDLVKLYRKKGFYCCTAILYNHESIRRGLSFVTRKIISNFVKLKSGEIESFTLGGIEQKKDWGYAYDYVIAMYNMLQQNSPEDFVLATGKLHSISDLVNLCASYLSIDNHMSKINIDKKLINRKLSATLCGDCSKAIHSKILKHSMTFEQLFIDMLEHELNGSL